MFGIAIIIIVLIAAFVVVGWYAHQRSQQRLRTFIEDELQAESVLVNNGFGDVFNREMQQQSDENLAGNIDSEPLVSLSLAATQQPQPKITKPISTPEVAEKQQEIISQQAHINDGDIRICFTVMARGQGLFLAEKIKTALESVDMHYGEQETYHRYTTNVQKQTLFSVANVIDPSTLNPTTLAATPGLLIFSSLPWPINGLALFDAVLEIAENLAVQLSGTLCDEQHQPINQQGLEKMRGRILSLNLSMQAEESRY